MEQHGLFFCSDPSRNPGNGKAMFFVWIMSDVPNQPWKCDDSGRFSRHWAITIMDVQIAQKRTKIEEERICSADSFFIQLESSHNYHPLQIWRMGSDNLR